jgi:phosphatidylinositol-3-phosphatase
MKSRLATNPSPLLMALISVLIVVSASVCFAQNEQEISEAPSHPHNIKTVFIIIMENHNWSHDIISHKLDGNTLAPYINFDLVPMASHANNYWNPPHNHPSLPNYLWLEAGTNFGFHADRSAYRYSQGTHEHLTALLDKKGISWKAYDESTNGKTCPLANWHNPFVFFRDETNNNDPHYRRCIDHVRPMKELARDLAEDKTARYSFIVPNNCHNMHDPCHGTNQIHAGDEWLREHVPAILRSTAYRRGGVLFILCDEARTGDGPIPMIVLSPFAKGNGYSNHLRYSHGSTLRTLQEIFAVGPLMRDAAKERDLRDLFTAFP